MNDDLRFVVIGVLLLVVGLMLAASAVGAP